MKSLVRVNGKANILKGAAPCRSCPYHSLQTDLEVIGRLIRLLPDQVLY